MTQTIDTTGEPSSAEQPLGTPKHPYLHVAEILEDLERVAGMTAEASAELALGLRAATPPSVQAGRERAKDGEAFGFIDPVALDRLRVRCAMLAGALDVVSTHVGTLSGEMLEHAVDLHLAEADDD